MKTGKSLSELAKELERRANNKQDIVADTRHLVMGVEHTEAENPTIYLRQKEAAPGSATMEINDIAHSQIASRLDIPAKYYAKMRDSAPELLTRNVNHWFAGKPEKRLIRMLDGNVRAFLSDRYQRIENEQIANAVLPVLLGAADVRVESAEITDSRMYIKAVFPRIQREVRPGDVVQSGIAISNSEVGQGAIKIEPLVYRLVCSNGMIVNSASMNARHVGGRIGKDDALYEILSDEAIKADDTAILLKVRDVVAASFDEVRFGTFVAQMSDAANDKMRGSPVEAVKVLARKYSLTEFEGNSVLSHLIEGADLSRYGMLNAVTRTAQDVVSYDRATELETLGGTILTLHSKEWKELAEAA